MTQTRKRVTHLSHRLYHLGPAAVTPLVALSLTLLVCITSVTNILQGAWADGHHDGNMLNGAMNILHGERLISHVQSIYGLFIPYLNAAQLYIFGETWASLWILPIILFISGLIIYYTLFTSFLGLFGSTLTLLIIVALNKTVLLPWSNYITFGLNALAALLFSRSFQSNAAKPSILLLVGVTLFIATLIRTQSVLLYPGFLAIIYLLRPDRWILRSLAVSAGLLVPAATFVLTLAFNDILKDYYLQTIAIQDLLYFNGKGPSLGLRQVFEVFVLGHALGTPTLPLGFAPVGAIFGQFWFVLFIANAYVVIRFGFRKLSHKLDRTPPTVLIIALLTAIGPAFAIHNVWDNFRYALHMSQGLSVIFYLMTTLCKQDARSAMSVSIFFFFVPIYALFDYTKDSIDYLIYRINRPSVTYVKYFEGVDLAAPRRNQLLFVQQFIKAYHERYPDSYIYTNLHTITDGIYAIGTFRVYDKTLTNDHFVSTYPVYYPEFARKLEEVAGSRRLLFFTSVRNDNRLEKYDYVKVAEINSLFIYIAKERANTFAVPPL